MGRLLRLVLRVGARGSTKAVRDVPTEHVYNSTGYNKPKSGRAVRTGGQVMFGPIYGGKRTHLE